MADAGVVRDANRLPWLEPYRAPPRKKSNRRAGAAAAIGAVGLAAVVTLLTRDMPFRSRADEAAPQASIVLPAPADMQPQIVLPPLHVQRGRRYHGSQGHDAASGEPAALPQTSNQGGSDPCRLSEVVKDQTEEIAGAQRGCVGSRTRDRIDLPLPPDPPRPAVNPTAQVVRGKTVQLGVYLDADARPRLAWQSTVRDYTYPRHHAQEHRSHFDPLEALLPASARHAVEETCQAAVQQFEDDRPALHRRLSA